MSGHGPGRSERVYRALLLMYPEDFRRRYGPQMVQVFGDLWREERERAGLAGLALLWARTWALGPWSMLPLVLLFAGTVLRLILLRTGLPMQNLPQAVGEGPVTLLMVHTPVLVDDAGWVLLGWALLRRSGEARLGRGMLPAYPSK